MLSLWREKYIPDPTGIERLKSQMTPKVSSKKPLKFPFSLSQMISTGPNLILNSSKNLRAKWDFACKST